MTYNDYQIKLADELNTVIEKKSSTSSDDILTDINDLSLKFDLTMGEIGEICELVRQIITKELPVEKFEEGLKEKLDEDNQPKVGDIIAEINEKIFVKLLPLLGLKALPIVIKPTTINTANVEIKDETLNTNPLSTQNTKKPEIPKPENPTPKTVLPPPPRPKPQPAKTPDTENYSKPLTAGIQPQRLSEFTSKSSPVSTLSSSSLTPKSSPPTYTLNPKPSTLLVEPSHERMSDNPMNSFLKMLSSKLSEKELQTRFDKLPFTLKTALRSIDSARTVVDIGRKHALHVDKIGTLGEETGMVILGITHPAQFSERLANNLGLNEELTRQIAQEINAEIFLKIREALKQVNGEGRNITVTKPINTVPQMSQTNYSSQSQQPQSGVITNEDQGEQLNREKILKEIENPAPVNPEPLFGKNTSPKMVSTNVPETQVLPPIPENLPVESEIPTMISNAISQETTTPNASEKPEVVYPSMENTTEKPSTVLPQSDATNNPVTQQNTKTTTGIIDKKLSETITAPKSESSYRVDPYREPLG